MAIWNILVWGKNGIAKVCTEKIIDPFGTKREEMKESTSFDGPANSLDLM